MSASDCHPQKLAGIRLPSLPLVAGKSSEHDAYPQAYPHPPLGSSGPTQTLINSSGKRPASAEPVLPVADQNTPGDHEESDFAANKVILTNLTTISIYDVR